MLEKHSALGRIPVRWAYPHLHIPLAHTVIIWSCIMFCLPSLSQSPFHIHVFSVSGYRCVFPELSVSTLSCQGMMLHSSARQWRRRKWDESSSSSSSSLWYMWCYISILYIGTVLLEFYSILWLRSYLPHAAHKVNLCVWFSQLVHWMCQQDTVSKLKQLYS